ncbi:MAG: PEGA domain-containing protein, partial [Candidatus Nephrothrix sp. EaCA]
KDQNGDVCALIKAVTTETGFDWDGDQLGIVKTLQKKGEIWIYVPFGAKRITISHAALGVLRNYAYPLNIEKAAVYEMALTTGKVVTVVQE